MGKVKKYDLTLDDEQPFEVYGISTAFADYRLTWELNQMLGIHLEKEQQRFELFVPKLKAQHAFSYFSYEDQELLTRFFLIKNKQDQQLLQADRPMIDYFLVLKDNFSHKSEVLLEQLRKINGIVAVFSFNYEEFDILDYLTS
ncbi:MAG: IPExxxVDY family protein [Crocinitomicaceae bacterium]|jgi:hypothetical protein|nr:IPExxxVDY family protein [Crocinitomicaceae bacterium]MDP4722886.1 IPExxxVDY family protein [Crocinitomicaceae bacterium]MDP4740331.1 IPExxxVDY family protein [Crocinitomicaceae bacterium]MDP4800169.1 IPExxxVDY family protein [Crocinitomicaceae bacterium]MDP4806811.1 IPExxxVDY family protein [Crocinitomicaceae bacterium]